MQPKLYIKTDSDDYPGVQVFSTSPQFEELGDLDEAWLGRKFYWGDVRVRVLGDTIIKGHEPRRILHVVPL